MKEEDSITIICSDFGRELVINNNAMRCLTMGCIMRAY